MLDVHDFILKNSSKKILFNNLEVVKFDCFDSLSVVPLFSPHDYIIYVLNGKRIWETSKGIIKAEAGDAFYIKKSAYISHQLIEDNFCALFIFIKDEFIQHYNNDLNIMRPITSITNRIVLEIKKTNILDNYFKSLLSYLDDNISPSSDLIKNKLRELILLLHQSNENMSILNLMLTNHWDEEAKFKEIITNNFMFDLSLTEFASLCNKSLSSFKRFFRKIYKTTPGKYLLELRLERASYLLNNTNLTISQISLESGFNNLSHFSKSFKERYNISAIQYRKKRNLLETNF